jgi:hypothetical protein
MDTPIYYQLFFQYVLMAWEWEWHNNILTWLTLIFYHSGSARMPSTRTTRPPLALTLRWSDLRCWGCHSVCSCESNTVLTYSNVALINVCVCVCARACVGVWAVTLAVYLLPGGTLQDKRGLSALLPRTTEGRKVRPKFKVCWFHKKT